MKWNEMKFTRTYGKYQIKLRQIQNLFWEQTSEKVYNEVIFNFLFYGVTSIFDILVVWTARNLWKNEYTCNIIESLCLSHFNVEIMYLCRDPQFKYKLGFAWWYPWHISKFSQVRVNFWVDCNKFAIPSILQSNIKNPWNEWTSFTEYAFWEIKE